MRRAFLATRVVCLMAIVIAFPLTALAQQEPGVPKTLEGRQDAAKPLRRPLRAALYPYVPLKAEMYWRLEQEFEDAYPEIDLRFVDLAADYYGGQLTKALTDRKVDVVEVDTVFLRDLVDQRLIAELPRDVLGVPGTFLPVAERAATLEGKIYGVPHWVCGNFLFFRADDPERNRLRKVRTLEGLERIIGRPVAPEHCVLTDFKGKSTLGEKYLAALFSICQDENQLLQRLAAVEADADAVRALARLFALCPGGLCDSDKHHEYGAFYAKQFTHRKARVLIGYSERLFFAVDEYLNGVREDEPGVGAVDFVFTDEGSLRVMGRSDIEVVPAPLADPSRDGTTMLAWVDVLTISAASPPQTRQDAERLISFFNDERFTKRLLIPDYGQAPRYLLPARTNTYSDHDLVLAAPLYPRFKEIMLNSTTITAPQLNDKLRAIGELIDGTGFSPQSR